MVPGCFLPPKKSDTHGEVHFDAGFKSEISQKFDLVPFSLFKNYVKWHQDVFCTPKKSDTHGEVHFDVGFKSEIYPF